jgi:hypothetical protein
MRPRTKLQVQIFALAEQLPNLAKKLQPWAFENCITHFGYRTKTATSCLSCGHQWKGKPTSKTDTCPACKRKLNIKDTRKKKISQCSFFSVIDVHKGFQLNRYFEIYSHHRAGEQPRILVWEIVQQWMQPSGKNEVIARNRTLNYYQDTFNGYLEIRDRSNLTNKYNIFPDKVYPNAKCLPIYKRNGFKGRFGNISPYNMFTYIITDNKAETLLKSNQMALLEARIGNRDNSVDEYWNSIKICIRRNYIVQDAITWLDYLELLRHFNKDLRNPKYVCPEDLKRAHDKLVAKKNEAEKRLLLEKQRSKIDADQKAYIEAKWPYFGLVFSRNNLTIKLLESVMEFFEEGHAHKHCVYTNEYYKKENSLVLSARVDSVPVETIELSLTNMKIVQSRGLGNKVSAYNEQIIELLNKNMSVIKKRYKELKSVVA